MIPFFLLDIWRLLWKDGALLFESVDEVLEPVAAGVPGRSRALAKLWAHRIVQAVGFVLLVGELSLAAAQSWQP